MTRTASVAISVALLASVSAAPPRPDAHLDRELARVRQDVERLVPAGQSPAVNARLERARAALGAGRVYLALYELEVPWEAASAWQFVKAKGPVESLDSFTALWKKEGEPRPGPPASPRLPAVVGAFIEAAEARGPATYRASLPYAQDGGVPAGLYYLGDSRASGAFARFARDLPWAGEGVRPAFRSIAAEIDTFDREVTTAYEKMDRSQHATYMLTSVTIKQARTLDGQGRHAGALLEYLLARYRFGALRGAGPDATAARVAEARHALSPSRDASIAQLFIEMAEAALDERDAAQHASAAVILNDVLPAYAATLEAPVRTTSAAAPARPQATITLVRWPFT